MDDRIKDTIVLVLMGLVIIFLIWAVNSSIKASNNKKVYQQETSRRMDAEQTLSKLTQEKNSLEKQLNLAESELNFSKETVSSLKKDLTQKQTEKDALQDELIKVEKLKVTLEEDLKEALTKCP